MMTILVSLSEAKTHFVRKDLQRQAKKAKGSELDEGDAAAAVITALDLEDAWKKSAEGDHFCLYLIIILKLQTLL